MSKHRFVFSNSRSRLLHPYCPLLEVETPGHRLYFRTEVRCFTTVRITYLIVLLMNKRIPLAVDKELIRLWYEFYRLALQSNEKEVKSAIKRSKLFYRDWNVDVSEPFDSWWSTRRSLFEQKNFVRVLSSSKLQSQNSILLEIPLTKGRTQVLAEIRALLPSLISVSPEKSHSNKYLPTEVQGVKRDALRIMLDLERRIFRNDKLKGGELRERVLKFFSEERFKRKKNRVPATFLINDYADTIENVDRNIRRYRQKVRQLILNVANGEFPGGY